MVTRRPHRSSIRRLALPVLAIALALPTAGLLAGPATAADKRVTSAVASAAASPPVVVSLGDSYISGEAGRWAGSSNQSSSRADALGATAYHDVAGGESTPRCHRSRSAEVFIGAGTVGRNLACSGARTTTYTDSDGRFKPGLDFYNDGAGRIGQALALQQVASTSDVDLVVVSIGGNDFDFAGVVTTCVANWLSSPSWWPNYCNDDSSVRSQFTSTAVANNRNRIAQALLNVRTAMRNAGYSDASWTLLVQTYPSPIPRGNGFRYSESGYTRQSVGGCGFWNRDADWANDVALPAINGAVRGAVTQAGLTNARVMDLSSAFNGRRLCETGVGLYEEQGLSNWTSAGAVNRTEWINQIRTVTTCCSSSPYYLQESLHPNYWAQLATRNCLRQAYNNGAPRGGTCRIAGNGLTSLGEPVMSLS